MNLNPVLVRLLVVSLKCLLELRFGLHGEDVRSCLKGKFVPLSSQPQGSQLCQFISWAAVQPRSVFGNKVSRLPSFL